MGVEGRGEGGMGGRVCNWHGFSGRLVSTAEESDRGPLPGISSLIFHYFVQSQL